LGQRRYWRYEIAGFSYPESWSARARDTFGAAGEWLELAELNKLIAEHRLELTARD
jgi:hypothetical protein